MGAIREDMKAMEAVKEAEQRRKGQRQVYLNSTNVVLR
jgi:hypothetical protein